MTNAAVASGCSTSYDWIDYFYRNAPEPVFPWNDGDRLSRAERVAVIASIQQFQLGEGATGSRMLERAQQFSRETGDLGLVAALRLFLREEQRHSRILARFLEIERAPRLGKHWVHTGFRCIRGIGDLELLLKVLVTAEILARPYYSALRDATGSRLLRSICERILDEESAHLRFQAFALRRFQKRHSELVRALIKSGHGMLLALTAGLVWCSHRSVFRAARRTFWGLWKDAWREFESLYESAS